MNERVVTWLVCISFFIILTKVLIIFFGFVADLISKILGTDKEMDFENKYIRLDNEGRVVK